MVGGQLGCFGTVREQSQECLEYLRAPEFIFEFIREDGGLDAPRDDMRLNPLPWR